MICFGQTFVQPVIQGQDICYFNESGDSGADNIIEKVITDSGQCGNGLIGQVVWIENNQGQRNKQNQA